MHVGLPKAVSLAALCSIVLGASAAHAAPTERQPEESATQSIDEGVAAEREFEFAELAKIKHLPQVRACDGAPVSGHSQCHARRVVNPDGTRYITAAPQGLTPADIIAAYNIPAAGGTGVTVGIVDAYDDPNAEADLAVYRAQFGLPECTTANGCFRKVNQDGKASPLPKADEGWSAEITLDLDAVSSACPNCNILLVEADSDGIDLGEAVVTAAGMGVVAISNSYGGSEEPFINTIANTTYYNHPNIFVTASTGDGGFGVEYPASSPNVVAVGGTSLVKATGAMRGWVEAAWGGAGSGCSKYQSKPSYQHDIDCNNRTVADVSAVADPDTGLAVYDTYSSSGGGWQIYGGTSLSSPLVAAIFAHVGATKVAKSFPYANPSAFYDVVSGNNGSCNGTYLCTSVDGYDGPTGIGTPNAAQILTLGGSTGGGGGGGGSTNTCAPGSTEILGACIGCNSTGQEGSVAWIGSALFAAVALIRARQARIARRA